MDRVNRPAASSITEDWNAGGCNCPTHSCKLEKLEEEIIRDLSRLDFFLGGGGNFPTKVSNVPLTFLAKLHFFTIYYLLPLSSPGFHKETKFFPIPRSVDSERPGRLWMLKISISSVPQNWGIPVQILYFCEKKSSAKKENFQQTS